MKKALMLLVCASSLLVNAQQNHWQPSTKIIKADAPIAPIKAFSFDLDVESLQTELTVAPNEKNTLVKSSSAILTIPGPEGQELHFRYIESSIMEAELQAKYPMIRTYVGQGIEDETATIRFDVTPKGFHAMIIGREGTIYIDPSDATGADGNYISYWKEDFYATTQKTFEEIPPEFGSDFKIDEEKLPSGGNKGKKPFVHDQPVQKSFVPSGTDLRSYRLALAATGEYSAFHGGTTTLALSAMVTSINRVNQVYERDVAIRMVLVGNTDQLIFLNGGTDPYNNGNGGAMLGENQTQCDNIIGSANYDIGHVYSTGGGGVAYLQSVCGGSKAGGVTGQAAPIGDPFDIDYVAHEMGHQFGGNHTQNNTCNRSTNAAYEPGSASTIMGYAGICPVNLQSNSNDYFHNHSYNEIISFSQSGNGNTCATITSTGNTPPTVDAGTGGFSIPVSTPFELTAIGNDADGDLITYTWEQYDLGPSTPDANSFNNPTGNQPIFRSWTGTVDPTRVFPRIGDLVNNTTAVGELLPTYSRGLSFRCMVRDNRAGGGGTNDDQIDFNVSDVAGPFLVVSPNAGGSFPALTPTAISWDVANTTASPISCTTVDIFLSLDGGLTYPITLATSSPNSGGATVILPDNQTTTARIKVKASNNIFFDISDQNFTITAPVGGVDFDAVIVGIGAPSGDFCGNVVTPQVTIANFGDVPMTSADLTYDIDGGTAQTFNWTGTLTTGQQEVINLSPITVPVSGSHTFNASLSGPNGQTDANPGNNTGTSTFSTITDASVITISFSTDCWGEEVGWTFTDASGTTLASVATGTYADQTTYTTDVCVAPGCYDFIITDSFGDGQAGIASGCAVDGSYSITDQAGTVLVEIDAANPNYGSTITESFCITPSGDVFGCTNATACNYNSIANMDDGSCEFISCAGCTDATACNFDGSATIDDGSCNFDCLGCTDASACNYNATATVDNGSCEFVTCAGCTDNGACNYDATATLNDGSCDYACLGCTDAGACNFDATSTIDDGSCEFTTCAGCTDLTACNYDATATIDNGSCEFISCAGCIDITACNYDGTATIDDGTCSYEITFYADVDMDGYGDIASPQDACTAPAGYVLNNEDCLDSNPNVYPGAPGTNEGLDNNCDNVIDQTETADCYGDINQDGFINVGDLLMILANYGCQSNCFADLNGDGTVDGSDMVIFLAIFGTVCP